MLFEPSFLHKYSQSGLATDIPLRGKSFRDNRLSMSLEFFSLPLEDGTNDKGLPFNMVI